MKTYHVLPRLTAWIAGLSLGLVACDSPADGPTPLDQEAVFAATSQEMEAFIAANAIPGAALAIVYDGQIRTAGFGTRRNDDPTARVTPDTWFHLFSISKSLTATAMMVLSEQGRLAPTDAVASRFPAFQLAGEVPSAPTIHQLLTHTSGLPDDTPLTNPSWSRCETSIADHWAKTTHKLWLEPGRAHIYSNEGYNLAGAVIETVAGIPYPDAMRTLVFEPLGLADIAFDNATIATHTYAHPHVRGTDATLTVKDLDFHGCPFEAPSMGAVANAETVARFARFLLRGAPDVLGDAGRAALMAAHVPTLERPDAAYGYGLERRTYKGLDIVFHSGRGLGTRAMMMLVPARDFAVVTLYNVQDADPYAMAFKAIDLWLAPEGVEPPADWTTDAATWTEYAGTWASDGLLNGAVIEARPAERVLWASILGGVFEFELKQVAFDHFAGEIPDITEVTVVFLRDAAGVITHVLSRAGVGVPAR